mgnify:CR=1 FL=1
MATSPFNKTYRKTFSQLWHLDIEEEDTDRAVRPLVSMPADDSELHDRIERELKQDGMYQLIKRIRAIAFQKNPRYIRELEAKPYPDIYWYKQHLLSLYLRHGTFRAIEKETGIPFESCHKTIRLTIQQLQDYARTIS